MRQTVVVDADGRDDALLIPVPRAAMVLGISTRSAWGLLRDGRLRSVRLGGRRLIRRRDLEDFVRDLDDEHRQ